MKSLETCPKEYLKEENYPFCECVRYLFTLGPRAWPVIFRTAIQKESPRTIFYWDGLIQDARDSGLYPAYESLFKEGQSVDEDIRRGKLISVRYPDSPCIFNPIPAYEKVMGAGSWPKDLPVSLIEDPNEWPKAKLDPKAPPRWGVKELEQYVENTLPKCYKPCGGKRFVLMKEDYEVKKRFWRVLRRGPEGIEAFIRAWVKTRDCDILSYFDEVLVEGTELGLFNYKTVRETLNMTVEEALKKKRLICFDGCRNEIELEFPGSYPNTDLKDRLEPFSPNDTEFKDWLEYIKEGNEPIPWDHSAEKTYKLSEIYEPGRTFWDGLQLLIDPRLAYEEKKGPNSWPKDLSLEVMGASYPRN